MLQLKGSAKRYGGVLHMGDWLCLYGPKVLARDGFQGLLAWPHRYDLIGTRAGRIKHAKFEYDAYPAAELAVGGQVFSGVNTSYVYTAPLPRQRLDALCVRRCKSGNGVVPRQWFVSVSPVDVGTPTVMTAGPRGGVYVSPVGFSSESGRYVYGPISAESGTPREDHVIARGSRSGDMDVCSVGVAAVGEDTPYRMYFRKYPKKNRRLGGDDSQMWSVPFGGDTEVTDFEFSADGRTLAVAMCRTYSTSKVHLFDVVHDELKPRVEFDVPARLMSFSEDGLTLACVGYDGDDDGNNYDDNTVTILDLD